MKRHHCRLLLAFPIAVAAAGLAGCDHEHDSPPADGANEYFYDCEDPKRPEGLTVFATDESLIEMLNKEAGAKNKEEETASLTTPAAGAMLSATAPPAIVISPPATGAQLQTAPPVLPGIRPRRALWRRALAWLHPVGTAYAHCKPVSGDNYLVRFSKEGEKSPAYAALSSVTGFTPNADKWKAAMMGRAGQTLKLTVLRAHYSGGTITDGPFVSSKTVTFSVGP